MKTLQIVDSAWRCTIEEQDDPVLWITAVMKAAGGDFAVLLSGNAAGYTVKAQDASGLAFGGKSQPHPPAIAADVTRLIETGVEVFLVQEDAAERGIEPGELVEGVQSVSRKALPKLFAGYDRIWHW